MKKIITLLMIVLIPLVVSCTSTQKKTSAEAGDGRMVVIPGGWFFMGSDEGEYNEGPEHEVFVPAFRIDRYEVSATEFADFLNEKGNDDEKFFSLNEYATVIFDVPGGKKEIEDEMKIRWRSIGDGFTYHVQIARDETFRDILVDEKVQKPGITFKRPEAPGTYFVRTSAVDSDGQEGSFSLPQSFEIEPVVEVPPKFLPRTGFERYPANNVSWFGADAYCRWAGKRLPSEAEWEKAARGTDLRVFPWGNSMPDESKARFNRNWDKEGFYVLLKVDSLPEGRSAYDVYQMAGNVWEWLADWFRLNYCDFCDPGGGGYLQAASELLGGGKTEAVKNPDKPPRRNPRGPSVGSFKVLRGGSWHEGSSLKIRASYRYWLDPVERNWSTGFRCADDIIETSEIQNR
jgi:formylglycine-generating enzyme required for sulfatase activity